MNGSECSLRVALLHLPTKEAVPGCVNWFPPFPQTSKDDLINTDFEGALKFFRVPVPKRYRSEENAKKLMELACSIKVSLE